jgi:PAS domain S-box-containing protein
MILKIKNDYHKMILTEKLNTAIIVFLLTVILSLIMAFLVSKTPTKLQAKLLKAYEKLNEFRIIIDKYVITATTKPDNTIVEVSSAFEKSSGYSKQELIGKLMSIIRHPQRDDLIIKELWNTILTNKTWEGEIKNRNKKGRRILA